MTDLQDWKQHREEMMQEVRRNRLAKELRGSRRPRVAGLAYCLVWELRRLAGFVRKLRKYAAKPDHDQRERHGK